MAKYDTADLLARAKRRLNRPATDEAFTTSVTDDVWYAFLTEGQDRAFQDLMVRAPDAMYGSPTALTSSDSGATYLFNSTEYALGHAQVYATRSDIPDNPLEEGIDYLYEGDLIRMPNNRIRTFSGGGPYARWVTLPGLIASGTEPTLISPARMLIVYDACVRGAERLDMDPTKHEFAYQQELGRVCLMLRTAVHPRISPMGRGRTMRITSSGGIVP